MQEEEKSRLFHTTSNTFINVLEKVQNRKVSNDTAWEAAQPLLQHYLPEYPENYIEHLEFIRELFNLRRDAFRAIDKEESSKKAKELVLSLEPEKEAVLREIIVYTRNIFDIKAGDRRNQRKSSSKPLINFVH